VADEAGAGVDGVDGFPLTMIVTFISGSDFDSLCFLSAGCLAAECLASEALWALTVIKRRKATMITVLMY